MMEKKRVYILVKTYPTISMKYAELVCTAGILEDGSWINVDAERNPFIIIGVYHPPMPPEFQQMTLFDYLND